MDYAGHVSNYLRAASTDRDAGTIDGRLLLAAGEIDRLRIENTNMQAHLRRSEVALGNAIARERNLRAEVETLKALAICGCGDHFTPDEPGECVNCRAGSTSALHVYISRLEQLLGEVKGVLRVDQHDGHRRIAQRIKAAIGKKEQP